MKTIRLPAQPHSDLNWELPIQEATQADQILWELDLGLANPYFPLEDELYFHALALALQTFSKDLWPQFSIKTKGAILYTGSSDFSLFFDWTEKQEANWILWKEDQPPNPEPHLRRLFCFEAFIAYFQLLAHKLPDELSLILRLRPPSTGTPAQIHHLLSPERFEHFQVEIEEMNQNGFVGVCFPETCSQEILERLDTLLQKLGQVRVIPEALLTEKWDGLDTIYILQDTLTQRGRRKLLGFQAAGGEVIETSL